MEGFIEIFNRMLVSSGMACLLAGMILLAKLAFNRKLSPSWHYYIWFLLILRLMLPFSLESSISIFNIVKPAIQQVMPNQGQASLNGFDQHEVAKETVGVNPNTENRQNQLNKGEVNEKSKDFITPAYPIDLKLMLIAIWLFGVLISSLYIIRMNLKLFRKIKSVLPADDALTSGVLNECKTKMNINRDIPVLYTEAICSPSLYGFWDPKILLPNTLKGKVSREELSFILIHELAHLQRCDHLFNWMVVLLKAVHWFNPVIWYAFYRMRIDCEVACDALALSYLNPKEQREYGYALINLLKMLSKSSWIPGTTGMIAGKSQMERRITMISLFKKESVQWVFIAVILFIAIGFVGLTDAKHEKDIRELRQTIEESNSLQQALTKVENEKNILEQKANALKEQIERNKILSGTADVEGKGVVVTITDGKNSYCDDNLLRDVINELVSAGAEAVAVNNERFVSTSEIRTSGGTTLINGRAYSSPYDIKAIGNPEVLESAIRIRGGIAEKLEVFKLELKIQKEEKLFIPKFKGEMQFKYAQPIESDSKE
ncbi:MAG: DUF881 domain-containing protein [Clostridia bacterium]|nr:DUF881 domain-containing protein [Clostridia bacterium]